MNLNPLENQECRHAIELIYEKVGGKYVGWLEMTEFGKDIYGEEGGYDYLLKSITKHIDWFLKAGDTDYRGDLFYLGKDVDNKYYFLNQGYGSCSGCDAFESATSYVSDLIDINELREDMKRNIIQFDSLEEFKVYIASDEIKGNYFHQSEDFSDFINKFNLLFDSNLE